VGLVLAVQVVSALQRATEHRVRYAPAELLALTGAWRRAERSSP